MQNIEDKEKICFVAVKTREKRVTGNEDNHFLA